MSPEGIALSLRVFLGIQDYPDFKIKNIPENQMQVLRVHESVSAWSLTIRTSLMSNVDCQNTSVGIMCYIAEYPLH